MTSAFPIPSIPRLPHLGLPMSPELTILALAAPPEVENHRPPATRHEQ